MTGRDGNSTMTLGHRTTAFAWVSVALLVTAACASAPKPPQPSTTRFTFAAATDTNPDGTGRPSPVVVRIYQLRASTAFGAAEFFALYDDEMKVLGPELIGRDEFVLAPDERRTVELAISGEAKFVGVVAAFRDIRNAQWRLVVPAPIRNNGTVAIERARIQYSAAD